MGVAVVKNLLMVKLLCGRNYNTQRSGAYEFSPEIENVVDLTDEEDPKILSNNILLKSTKAYMPYFTVGGFAMGKIAETNCRYFQTI